MTDTEHARRNAERLAGLTEPYLTLDQAATKAGLDPAQVAAIWTATGLPTPERDDPCLGDGDVEILRTIADLQACGLTEPDFVLQLARVCGRHLRRSADAQISAARQQAGGDLTDHARHTVPILERALTHLWRRHLADAATRALLDSDDSRAPSASSTSSASPLAASNSTTANSPSWSPPSKSSPPPRPPAMAAPSSRPWTTKCSSVLFVHDDPDSAARIALELLEQCDDDPVLPMARGGLAWGNPLVIGGDYFGPPVNLASRIVKLALPDTVLADPTLAEQLHDIDDLTTKPLRTQPVVRDVGDIALHVVRRTAAPTKVAV